MKRFISLFLLTGLLAGFSLPVDAEVKRLRMPMAAICSTNLSEIKTLLADHYNEVSVSQSVDGEGFSYHLFMSPGGATWTWVTVHPSGQSCVFFAGTDFEFVAPDNPVPGEPS